LIADGTVTLEQPVDDLLPELASPAVVRRSPVQSTRPFQQLERSPSASAHLPERPRVPIRFLRARRSTSVRPTASGPPQPQVIPPPDEWMAILADIPLLHQPGEAFVQHRVRHPRRAARALAEQHCPISWRHGSSNRSE
jgi:hypothetical protein